MTNLEAAILDVLEKGPSYGLAIYEALPADARPVEPIYPTLRAMEARGWLRSWDGPPLKERGGRPRRYYAVTESGQSARAAEEHWRESLASF